MKNCPLTQRATLYHWPASLPHIYGYWPTILVPPPQDSAKSWESDNIVCSKPEDTPEQMILREGVETDVAFT